MRISLRVNGVEAEADCWEGESLLYALREKLGYPGSKNACEQGECGSCSVLLDGTLVCACLVLAAQADGHDVTTVEGLADGERLHPVQEAFVETGAVQCGFCTPGPRRRDRRPARADARPDRRRDPRGALRQPLPLHGLREDLRRGPPGCAGRLGMNRHESCTKDTLRAARPRGRESRWVVGGPTPHPGWGEPRWGRRRARAAPVGWRAASRAGRRGLREADVDDDGRAAESSGSGGSARALVRADGDAEGEGRVRVLERPERARDALGPHRPQPARARADPRDRHLARRVDDAGRPRRPDARRRPGREALRPRVPRPARARDRPRPLLRRAGRARRRRASRAGAARGREDPGRVRAARARRPTWSARPRARSSIRTGRRRATATATTRGRTSCARS